MRDKKLLYFGIAILILASCVIKEADLRLVEGPFVGIPIEGKILFKFGVVNLGHKTAENAFVLLDLIDSNLNIVTNTYNLYLGNIRPGETKWYELKFLSVEWGSNIRFQGKFKWD